MERKDIVTMAGMPVTITGTPVNVGDRAPDFTVLTADLQPKSLKDFSGKVIIISVTPSLDTQLCDLQATRFNQEAEKLPGDAVVLNISVDLPFAIGRFCAAKGVDKVITLSDHRELSFGNAWGVVVKEARLLARAVFVVDQSGKISYLEIVSDITKHPDYDRALAEARKLL